MTSFPKNILTISNQKFINGTQPQGLSFHQTRLDQSIVLSDISNIQQQKRKSSICNDPYDFDRYSKASGDQFQFKKNASLCSTFNGSAMSDRKEETYSLLNKTNRITIQQKFLLNKINRMQMQLKRSEKEYPELEKQNKRLKQESHILQKDHQQFENKIKNYQRQVRQKDKQVMKRTNEICKEKFRLINCYQSNVRYTFVG